MPKSPVMDQDPIVLLYKHDRETGLVPKSLQSKEKILSKK